MRQKITIVTNDTQSIPLPKPGTGGVGISLVDNGAMNVDVVAVLGSVAFTPYMINYTDGTIKTGGHFTAAFDGYIEDVGLVSLSISNHSASSQVVYISSVEADS